MPHLRIRIVNDLLLTFFDSFLFNYRYFIVRKVLQ